MRDKKDVAYDDNDTYAQNTVVIEISLYTSVTTLNTTR